MKVSCRQADLSLALERAGRAMPPRKRPHTEQVRLEASGETTTITVESEGCVIASEICAATHREGAVSMTYGTLARLVTGLPDARIDLETEDTLQTDESAGVIHLACGRSSARMRAKNTAGTPKHDDAHENGLTMTGEHLIEAIRTVEFAADDRSDQARLTGANIRTDGDGATFATSDGKRLALYVIPIKNTTQREYEWLPTREGMVSAACIASPQDTVKMAEEAGKLRIRTGRTVIIPRTIPTNFPRWEQLIPEQSATEVVADLAGMREAMHQAGPFAKAGSHIVRIYVRGEHEGENTEPYLLVGSQHEDLGHNYGKVPVAQVSGPDGKVALNVRYLNDLLRIATGDAITMKIGKETEPIVFKSENGLTHVVMPQFIQW